MTKLGSVAQYVGRQADLVVFHGVAESGESLLEMSLAEEGGSGKIVAGPQKVAQRFLLELLREKGTMPLRSSGGSDFMTEARMGLFRTAIDVMGAFARAVVDIRTTLQAEESDSDPDDERFQDAELVSAEVSASQVSIRVRVLTRAGESREFLFPLKVLV